MQAALTLTLIATTLPIVSQYVMSFVLFLWLLRGGRWRLAAAPPELRPLCWGVAALVGTQLLAALLGCAFSEWGEPLGMTLADFSHTANRMGLQWVVLSGAVLAAGRRGWTMDRAAPWMALWLLVHFVYCFVQRETGIDWVHGLDAHLEQNRFAYGVYRVSGVMGHPLTLAYNLMLVMLAALTRRHNKFWVAVAVLCAATLLISGSRFVFIVIILTLATHHGRDLRRHWRWLLGGGLAAAGLLVAERSILGRFGEIFDQSVPLAQRFPRVMYWRLHGQMFLDHPLFGVTSLGRPRAAAAYYSAAGYHDNLYIAHNVFLQFLADTGLIGFAGLVLFLLGLFLSLGRLGGWLRAPAGYLVTATLISGLMQNNLLDSSYLQAFWFLLALLLVQTKSDARQPTHRESPKDLQPAEGGADPA